MTAALHAMMMHASCCRWAAECAARANQRCGNTPHRTARHPSCPWVMGESRDAVPSFQYHSNCVYSVLCTAWVGDMNPEPGMRPGKPALENTKTHTGASARVATHCVHHATSSQPSELLEKPGCPVLLVVVLTVTLGMP